MGFKGKSISIASYDAGNRLTAWNRAGADENHSQTWDYDNAGNWNSTTKDGDTESRDHSVSDQITQLDGKAVSHDLKGNLTNYEYDRTDYRVKYDLDNRIVEVKADSETIRYRYDAPGRRIISKGDDETILIWWGDSECAEYEHRASKDAIQNDIMGHPTRLNSVIARDTEDRENRVELQWYHKNYLDHIYAVSDKDGDIKEHYRYTALGEAEIYNTQGQKLAESAIDNDVLWNSRRFDGDTGLYYYKYRHYAAKLGRWLGRDPIEEDGGINLYAFVGNDVVNRFDYLGLAYGDYEINKQSKMHIVSKEQLREKIHELIHLGGIMTREISKIDHAWRVKNNKKFKGMRTVSGMTEWAGRVCVKCLKSGKLEVYHTKAYTSFSPSTVAPYDAPACAEGYDIVGLFHNHPNDTGLSDADYRMARTGKKTYLNPNNPLPKNLIVPPNTIVGATRRGQGGVIETMIVDPSLPVTGHTVNEQTLSYPIRNDRDQKKINDGGLFPYPKPKKK